LRGRVSPLDRVWGLLPGKLPPSVQELLDRLGQAVPSFAEAMDLLRMATRLRVSAATTRRYTERAGALLIAHKEAVRTGASPKAAPGPEAAPTAPPGKLFVEVDGAFVPLVHGEWAEVKTLAIGEGVPNPHRSRERPDQEVRLTARSYFSRLADWETFSAQATSEFQRRQVRKAAAVATGSDGADWCQSVFDQHCPGALRLLDFGHAGERLGNVSQLVFAGAPQSARGWVEHASMS